MPSRRGTISFWGCCGISCFERFSRLKRPCRSTYSFAELQAIGSRTFLSEAQPTPDVEWSGEVVSGLIEQRFLRRWPEVILQAWRAFSCRRARCLGQECPRSLARRFSYLARAYPSSKADASASKRIAKTGKGLTTENTEPHGKWTSSDRRTLSIPNHDLSDLLFHDKSYRNSLVCPFSINHQVKIGQGVCLQGILHRPDRVRKRRVACNGYIVQRYQSILAFKSKRVRHL